MMATKGATDERRVVLHLGMHKTGSTSIQSVWSGYKDDRIEYADLGLANHSLTLLRAFLHGRPADRVFHDPDPAERQRQTEFALRRLGKALKTRRSLILSGESTYRFDEPSAKRCVDFLRRHGGRVEALLYVRAPESFTRSAFQERLKVGRAKFDIERIMPAYRRRAMVWADAIGAEPTYVLFHRSSLLEGDVVADFGMRLGLDPNWARERKHLWDRNGSFSAEAMAALYLLRHRMGPPEPNDEERLRQKRIVEVLQGYGSRRYDFGREVVERGLAGRATEIAWMEERLGRSFPKEAVENPVVFENERDLLDYGESQAAALRDYLMASELVDSPAGSSTTELLDAVRRLPVAEPSERHHAPSRVQRLTRLLGAARRLRSAWT